MTIRFGDFVLDSATRRLLRSGGEVHLSPKAFMLLSLLVENRAKAMSKADLQAALWPSTYVLETNLASLIAELRRALDDSAEDPQFIRTVPRFGYWFVGLIAAGASASATPDPAMVRCWLIWEARQVALAQGENVLGRAPDAHVWIDATGVSRRHARITISGSDATIEDLGSKNGTYVRGEQVTAAQRVVDGDQVRIGSVVMTFRVPPPPHSTETVES
jgi:DNA-binding winged helix-turn-helix (wHTH) protein